LFHPNKKRETVGLAWGHLIANARSSAANGRPDLAAVIIIAGVGAVGEVDHFDRMVSLVSNIPESRAPVKPEFR
jgi:hypothetical protein